MSLRNVRADTVAWELAILFTQLGLPKQVVSDQGTAFMSETLKAMWRLARVQPLRTSVYYPQMNGLVGRSNGTLKRRLCMFVGVSGTDWHVWLPFLLFAMREDPQASTGSSPFELLYSHHPWGY